MRWRRRQARPRDSASAHPQSKRFRVLPVLQLHGVTPQRPCMLFQYMLDTILIQRHENDSRNLCKQEYSGPWASAPLTAVRRTRPSSRCSHSYLTRCIDSGGDHDDRQARNGRLHPTPSGLGLTNTSTAALIDRQATIPPACGHGLDSVPSRTTHSDTRMLVVSPFRCLAAVA